MSIVNQATYLCAQAAPAARLEPLPHATRETCDGCGPGTIAQVTVILPVGGLLTLCGHHARPFGYVPPEPGTRLRGSEH